MKRLLGAVVLLLVTSSCSNQALQPGTATEEVTLSVTKWTDKTELFMEYPALVAGETGRFAVHFTDIRNFTPIASGRVTVELAGSGWKDEFVADPQSRPGIFGVNVTPRTPGNVAITVRLEGPMVDDTVPAGDATIHENAQQAAQAAPAAPAEERIAFLKEQQWALDFATALVSQRPMKASLYVPAEVMPRTGGSAEVTVPFKGTLVASSLPAIGTHVTQGQVLAQLLPPTSVPSDFASLELAESQTRTELELARKDRERTERLLAAGAVATKRVDEARAAESTAEARLKAAQNRLAQYDTSSTAGNDARGAKLFALRAPIAGTIAETHAAPGANVDAGEVLFQIIDLDTVYVSAIVPEAEFPQMGRLSGAELEIPGAEATVPLRRLISIGRVVDPASRTFPVIYEINNRERRVAVNQTVHVRLFTSAAGAVTAVPESAIVDDAGRPIVFVQVAGESFLRRPVTIGIREGGYVQVTEGIQPGERVVTRGAPLIRLASMSSQVPAHGHVH